MQITFVGESQREKKMPGTNMVQEKDFLEEGRLEEAGKRAEKLKEQVLPFC